MFIIGGASLYELALPIATDFHLTEVFGEVQGDVFFPQWDEGDWNTVVGEIQPSKEYDGSTFPWRYRHLSRKHDVIASSSLG